MRKLTFLAAIASSLTLAGCMGGGGSPNRSMESVHQPVVTQQNFTFDVRVDDGSVSPQAQQQISNWIEAMDVRYGDRVSIDDNGALASRPLRDAVDEMLRRRGMMLADNAPITPGAIPAGAMRIIISRAHARVDGCPVWRGQSATDFMHATGSNYGCATNANMAAMVADPLDLIRGQSDRSNDPLTASNAVDGYRGRASQSGGMLPPSNGGSAAPAMPAGPGGGR